MRKMIVFALFTCISMPVLSAPELKGSPQDLKGFLYPSDKIVTINGQADEKAYSDRAIVSLVITTENKLLSDAIATNSELRSTISKSLMQKGIPKDAIKSSKFSSSPQYGWFGSKPASYKVVNRMAVTISNETHLKDVALVADQSAEVTLSDTTFEHSKKDEFNEKVKAKALEKILKQRSFYETTLGVTLTPVGIREAHIHQYATKGARMLDQVVVTSARSRKAEYSSMESLQDRPAASSFDEIKYEAALSVDFKIAN